MKETAQTSSASSATRAARPIFGVNEMRLTGRQWFVTSLIVATCTIAFPTVWKHYEPFPNAPDYRIPYALSRDYWLYQRRMDQLSENTIPVVGDSVVWGEYVKKDGTLSHFLNERAGNPTAFANAGVNGMFPLALEGLLHDYGGSIRQRKVIVQCNLLWLTSPKADLSAPGDGTINHSRLLPQFAPPIPSYNADSSERLSATFERHVPLLAWAEHVDCAYFGEKSIPQWTLEEGNGDPPDLPNAWRNPLDNLRKGIPTEPAIDRQRGPNSYRHRPWNSQGAEPSQFDWVRPSQSLQFQAFLRVLRLLRWRDNDVLVILGPFNEHMVSEDQRSEYESIRDEAARVIGAENAAIITPSALPSELYADASHPLTKGYAKLAEEITADPVFEKWRANFRHH